MCHSTEPRGRRYVKGYRLLSFAKNIGKNLSNQQVNQTQMLLAMIYQKKYIYLHKKYKKLLMY